MTSEATIQVDSPGLRNPTPHRWFARRTELAAAAVALLANDPALALEPASLLQLATAADRSPAPLDGRRVLDLCSGAATVGLAAARLGGRVTSIDNHPIPVLIGRCLLQYGPSFEKADPAHRGVGPSQSWDGLASELRHWSRALLDHLQQFAGEAWLGAVDAVVCRPMAICPACGSATDLVSDGENRASAACLSCRSSILRRDATVVGFAAVREIREGSEAPVSQEVTAVLASAEYPTAFAADQPFVSTRYGTIPVERALTPRQATVLAASQRALRRIRDDLAERGYGPGRVAALVTTLGLGLSSSLVEMLTTMTRWDEQRHRVRGFDTHQWILRWEFAEAGGAQLRRRFERQIEDPCSAIAAGEEVGVALSGDMRSIDLPDDLFDVVVWDPPFYDNIDYRSVATPWVQYLRTTIGELHPDLDWASSSSLLPVAPFDHQSYEGDLVKAAAEIARLLSSEGTLGVFWVRRHGTEEQDLQGLLRGLESSGFELVQSVRLDKTLSKFAMKTEPVFLIFRKSVVVQPSNAVQLVAGLGGHRLMMAAGLADLLERYLEDDDLDELIPPNFRGTRRQRLQEAVMSDRNPLHLTARLRRRELAEFVEERSPDAVGDLPRDDLAELALELLGWQIPRPTGFSIGDALDECDRQVSVLRFTTSETEARGAAKAALVKVEEILRFSVIAWAHLIAGDDWQRPIAEVVERSSRLSFGQWRRAFTDLPLKSAAQHEALGQATSRLRRAKLDQPLDNVVRLRNDIDHPDRAPWDRVRIEAPEVLSNVVNALRSANEAGALPRVLQPAAETRDPYGRITLRLVGYGGRSVEFLMTGPSDLTIPVVHFPGATNPREVHPALLQARTLQERAGLM